MMADQSIADPLAGLLLHNNRLLGHTDTVDHKNG